MPTITVIGSLNADIVTVTSRIPGPGETLRAISFDVGSGGKGANQAVAAARLSRVNPASEQTESLSWPSPVKVRMIGAVGADTFGDSLLKSLASDGVDISGVRRLVDEKTGTATIIVEQETGENRILFTPGANFALKPSDDLVGQQGYGDLVLFQLESPFEVVREIYIDGSVTVPLAK